MEKVYKIRLGWRIFLIISLIMLAALFSYVGIMPFIFAGVDSLLWNGLFILFGFGIAGIAFYGVIYTLKYRLFFEDDCVVEKAVFKEKRIKFENLIGYRLMPNNQGLILLTSNKKVKLEITFYTESPQELFSIINEKFTNLDIVDIHNDAVNLLAGIEEKNEKEFTIEKLEKIRKLINILNKLVFVIAIWLFIYPNPYEVAVLTNLFFPILAIMIICFYKGLVVFDEVRNSVRPSVIRIFILPSMVLALRAFLDIRVIYEFSFWVGVIIVSLMLYAFIAWKTKEFKNIITSLLVIVFIMLYVYGASLQINKIFDYSTSDIYKSNIVDKRISEGSTTDYYIKISPWKYINKEYELSTYKEFYELAEVNDVIEINVKKGSIGIKWYYIRLTK